MHPPASGLTVALDPIMRATGGTWVAHGSGDADRLTVDARDRVAVPPETAYTLRRVWLTKDTRSGYYYGLGQQGLWPLCHIAFHRPIFAAPTGRAYREVNAHFRRGRARRGRRRARPSSSSRTTISPSCRGC